MKANHDYQIGDQVLFPAVDAAPFLVVGVRADSLEIQGDFSGGTHNVIQTDWVSISELEHYQPEPNHADQIKEESPVLPTTLDESVDYFLPRFESMETYMKQGEDDFAAFCHSQLSGGIGMQIRNELKLWQPETPLHQYFLSEQNLFHPDEMSDLIIRHIYRKLNPDEQQEFSL